MNEIWINIKGYDGLYQVSNLGRIKRTGLSANKNDGRKITYKERILKQTNEKYPKISLSKNNKISHLWVHQIVAKTFIPNPKNKPCINHKNNNSKDNRVENLEWVTYSENTQHAYKNNLIKKKTKKRFGGTKLTEEDVLKIRELSKTKSSGEIAKMFNIDPKHVWQIKTRKRWKKI